MKGFYKALFSLVFLVSLTCSAAAAVLSTTYYHADLQGSPVAATNEAGQVIWREIYKPFGEKIIDDMESFDNDRAFTGYVEDRESGLLYAGARYYHPATGRFMGTDPVYFDEDNIHSFNRYAYANNNPYRYIDPDGNSPVDIVFFAIDAGRLGVALYSGDRTAIQSAAVDLALSTVGVFVPVPGAGQALKIARLENTISAAAKGAGRNLPFKDAGRLTEVNKTLDRIESGGPFPYKKDGTIFMNKNGRLPEGNYREYTVDTPGASNRGERRVVQNTDTGKTYYTDDHYRNFTQIDPAKK
jgi:RHS repeat-associated protein